MNLLRNVRISTRLVILVALPLLGLVGLGVLAYSTTRAVGVGGEAQTTLQRNSDLTADILPPPLFLVETFLAVHSLADSDASAAPAIVKQIEDQKKAFAERAKLWRETLGPGPIREAMLEKVLPTGEAFLAAVETEFMPVARNGGGEAARDIVDRSINGLFVRHREAVSIAVQNIGEEVAKVAADTKAMVARRELIMLGSILTIAVASLGTGVWIARNISKPLTKLTVFIEDLGGDGDLRQRIPNSDERSELGRLSRACGQFVERVNSIILEVGNSSREVTTHAERIAAAAEQSERSVEGQAASLAEISQDVDRMVGESQTIADQAQQAAAAAGQTREVATKGGQTVERTIKGMKAIEEAVGAGAQDVQELGKKSEEIGRIIQVINDIADQTNLLALNAAIEAARAGEHGRGFAVVADEVRKLAERTTGATKQVAESIRCIQEQTGHAVERMQAGTERVREGVSMAGEASAALEGIVSRVVSTTTLIDTISKAVQNNNQIGQQVRSRVEGVASSAREVGEAAKSSAAATAELQSRTRALTQMVATHAIDRRAAGDLRQRLDPPGTSNLGAVVDVSERGAGVELSSGSELATGDEVLLNAEIGGKQRQLAARVARTASRDGKRVAGLKFVR